MYEVRPDGTIVVESLEEALALQRRIQEGKGKKAPIVSAAPTRAHEEEQLYARLDSAATDRARAFLAATAEGGKAGVKATALATKLGEENPQGLASYVKVARAMIAPLANGHSVDYYLFRTRGRDGSRWFVKADALKAIGLL